MRLLIVAPVFLVTVGGSHPTSPARAVFAPLIPRIERSFSEQPMAPEFVAFADWFTATALKGWPTSKSPQLTATGSVLTCPWSKTKGVHGYSVRVQLDSLVGSNAVARYEITCTKGARGGFATGEVVQLERRNGKWSVSRVIDRRIT